MSEWLPYPENKPEKRGTLYLVQIELPRLPHPGRYLTISKYQDFGFPHPYVVAFMSLPEFYKRGEA